MYMSDLCAGLLGVDRKESLCHSHWAFGTTLEFILTRWQMVVPLIFYAKKWVRMGAGLARKTNHMIRGLGLWAKWYLLRRRERLESEFNHVANESINPAYKIKPQCKLWTPKLGWTSLVGNTYAVIHWCTGKVTRTDSTERRGDTNALCLKPSQTQFYVSSPWAGCDFYPLL